MHKEWDEQLNQRAETYEEAKQHIQNMVQQQKRVEVTRNDSHETPKVGSVPQQEMVAFLPRHLQKAFQQAKTKQ